MQHCTCISPTVPTGLRYCRKNNMESGQVRILSRKNLIVFLLSSTCCGALWINEGFLPVQGRHILAQLSFSGLQKSSGIFDHILHQQTIYEGCHICMGSIRQKKNLKWSGDSLERALIPAGANQDPNCQYSNHDNLAEIFQDLSSEDLINRRVRRFDKLVGHPLPSNVKTYLE